MITNTQIAVPLAMGVGGAMSLAMVGALGRQLGSIEAAWISMLGTLCGMLFLVAVKVLRGGNSGFTSPLNRLPVLIGAAISAALLLVWATWEVEAYYVATGLFGAASILSAAIFLPRLGLALYTTVFTLGTVSGALALDHVGAFGADPEPLSVLRVTGVGAVALGSVIVRTAK